MLCLQLILKQVKTFVTGSTYGRKICINELVQSAVFLLEHLPSARQAVLQYLSSVFHDAVNNEFVSKDTSDIVGARLDSIINDVQQVMMKLVKGNADAWAPIISAWSIELLGHISSLYADRHGVPHTSSLNELLQKWMTCVPTKVLIEIASECFASMIGGAPDVCVDALLEASVKHSPHFDWVVAHIGSCFPKTIITRVLMYGLEDYYIHGSSQSVVTTSSEEKIPKMASVVGILGHLAGHHSRDIRQALLTLFQESLQPSGSEMQQCAVPFMLQLASMSPMLLTVIATNLVHTLTTPVMNRLAEQFKKIGQSDDYNSLISLVVHLLMRTEDGAYTVMEFLFETASPSNSTESSDAMETDEEALTVSVQLTCVSVIERLLIDLQRVVHNRSNYGSSEVALLSSLRSHMVALCEQLTSASGKRHVWLSKLLTNLAVHCGENDAANILCHIALTTTQQDQLWVFLGVQQQAEIQHPQVLENAIQHILDTVHMTSTPDSQRHLVLTNLLWLVRTEESSVQKKMATQTQETIQMQSSVCHVLQNHLVSFASLLYSDNLALAKVAMEIVNDVGLPEKRDITMITKLCAATVVLLLHSLQLTDMTEKCHISGICRSCMQKLSQHSTAQRMLLRFLLEGALSSEHSPTLGGRTELVTDSDSGSLTIDQSAGQVSLLQENRHLATTIVKTRSQLSIFHAGVIGQGHKRLPRPPLFTPETLTANRHIFLNAFAACTHETHTRKSSSTIEDDDPAVVNTVSHMTPKLARILALLMIELVSPDVMYNGIPWPEEEFMKVTIERDLLIKKKFENNPVLWDILKFLSAAPGAMCYCSVIIRGLVATLLAHWETSLNKSTRHSPWHLEASVNIVECMWKGQILLPPLCHVAEIFHLLTPYEVHMLLKVIWRYVKENPPVPDPREDQSSGCYERYTQVLRSILHGNIDKLGTFYARFFTTTAASK
ncbi:hypothetical protein NP493_115g08009 [Ridgeia piscesae]|uniref:Integrator complex subunit 5 n=1 Tax=Ridgeia piscesae TaxID=27915 RepID=A0AAD9UH82_RIDPI|nr:hypothetical protein NP493_115g08009 [Ridgeia piscesae]